MNQDIPNVSDYGVGVKISKEQTNEVIGQAKEFIGAGRNHLT
jgi:hypothetical protein